MTHPAILAVIDAWNKNDPYQKKYRTRGQAPYRGHTCGFAKDPSGVWRCIADYYDHLAHGCGEGPDAGGAVIPSRAGTGVWVENPSFSISPRGNPTPPSIRDGVSVGISSPQAKARQFGPKPDTSQAQTRHETRQTRQETRHPAVSGFAHFLTRNPTPKPDTISPKETR